jgi:hypothetical protein
MREFEDFRTEIFDIAKLREGMRQERIVKAIKRQEFKQQKAKDDEEKAKLQ